MTYSRFLPVAALLLAACATAPCVNRQADPPALTRTEVSPQREAAMAALRSELDQIIAANRAEFERTHADEIARLAP